jgi:ABC-type sugar transport system ATPase subunit
MPEVIKLVDRILVFNDGKICGDIANSREYADMSKQIMGKIITKNV